MLTRHCSGPRFLLPRAILLTAALPLLCGLGCDALEGNGIVTFEERSVSGFQRLEIRNQASVLITQLSEDEQAAGTTTETLSIEAEGNLIPHIETQVSKERLSIDNDTLLRPTLPIQVYLQVLNLSDISISGSGDVEANDLESETLRITVSGSGTAEIRALTADSLTVAIPGSGDVELGGSTRFQQVNISGSGNYRGSSLESQTGIIEVSGSGNAQLNVTDTLTAVMTGSGDVEVVGGAIVTPSISGSGELTTD